MTAKHTMQGVQDLLEVFDDKVQITPKGVLGFLNKGLKGTKTIPFTSIKALQFKEAGAIISGYIQFTIMGGNESRGGVFAASNDENTFMFAQTKNNAQAKEIKNFIEEALAKSHLPQQQATTLSLSEELQKLATLRDQGILSEQEFITAKQKLMQ